MTAPDPIPDYQSVMLPVLKIAEAGEVRIRDVVQKVGDELSLSEADRNIMLPSGGTRLSNRVHWAKTYLAKAGLLEATRRGHFRITRRGQEVLATHPQRIDNRLLGQFEEFRRFIRAADDAAVDEPVTPTSSVVAEQTPDELMRAAHRRIEAELADELLDRVRTAPAEFFERLIVKLLLAMGYGGAAADAGRALGRSGDDGVDGVIDQDALGLDRVYIQAKRYGAANAVGAGAIRDFFGSLDRHKAAKGLFVTTSTYSRSARETADMLSKRIVLIDGEQLARLMIRFDIGCRVEETLYLKRIDEDFFE